jgi:hypothetical protein
MISNDNNYANVDSVIDEIRKEFIFGSINEEGNKVFLTVTELSKKFNVSYKKKESDNTGGLQGILKGCVL